MVLQRVEPEVGGAATCTSPSNKFGGASPSNKLGGGLDQTVLDAFPRFFSHPDDGGIWEVFSRPCKSKMSGYPGGFGDHD
jgi:hypothetical protein